MLGALILYAIARLGGRPLILRLRPLLRITERDLDRADGWFDRRAVPIVLFGRLIPGVRSLVSVPAGLSEMPIWRFLAATAYLDATRLVMSPPVATATVVSLVIGLRLAVLARRCVVFSSV